MKKLLIIIGIIIFIPLCVNAETLTYNICKSGCEYSDLSDIINEINGLNEKDIIINLNDSYGDESSNYIFDNIKSLTINGNNNSITASNLFLSNINNIVINDLSVDVDMYLIGPQNSIEPYISYSKSNKAVINNSNFIAKQMSFIMDYTVEYNESYTKGAIMVGFADVSFRKSRIESALFSGMTFGAPAYDTNIDIYPDNEFIGTLKRVGVNEVNSSEEFDVLIKTPGTLMELLMSKELIDNLNSNFGVFGINIPYSAQEMPNRINFHQNIVKNKKINKRVTSLKEIEVDVLNLYDDSVGYEGIIDEKIEWNSQDETILKVQNEELIRTGYGEVELMGTRGNDTYTVHLDVEKETLPEKIGNLIEKKTIKVPITGKEVKLWIVIVVASSLIIIGCSILLIIKKRKKKTTK